MQDKQIIIKRIRDCDNCRFRPETSKVCEIYDNCYLVSEHICNLREQLRTKEQECEELKETLKTKAKGWANVNDKILEEVDQLKEQLEAYKMEAEEGKEINAELKAENDELKEQFKLAEPLYQACNIKDKKINKLKQTLTEIKEICTKYKEICANCEGDEYIDCVDCTEGGEAQVAIKVLQICDEVKDV